MLTPFFVFAAALAALLAAARFFTGAAERLGLALGMSPFIVGVFIVAIGTSLPELVASVLSVLAGTSEIVAGNVLGANAANLLLVLGAVSVAVPAGRILLGEQYLFIDLHFLLGATLALGTAMADGRVTPVEGWLLLAGYVVYVAYLLPRGAPRRRPRRRPRRCRIPRARAARARATWPCSWRRARRSTWPASAPWGRSSSSRPRWASRPPSPR
jgi:cation:H+ antiporter